MAFRYRQKSDWSSFSFVCLTAIILMVVDARTAWLNSPRNWLAMSISPIQYLAGLPNDVASVVTDTISAESDIKVAYQTLRSEYFQLKSETLLLRGLQDENAELRLLLSGSERLNESISLADLINVNIDPNSHRMLIRRGIRHGVYSGQAVVDDSGVIGQVTEVMPYNSTITLISDPRHALPVQIKRTGMRTLIYGTGNVASLRVPFLNQNADILVGDILVCSGLGGRFPIGYPVATVTQINPIADEGYIQVTAEPIAKLDRSNYVLLLFRQALVPDSDADVSITTQLLQ